MSLASRLAWLVFLVGLLGASGTAAIAVFWFTGMSEKDAQAQWSRDIRNFATIIASPLGGYNFANVSDLGRVFIQENKLTDMLEIWHIDGVKVTAIGGDRKNEGAETITLPIMSNEYSSEQVGYLKIRKTSNQHLQKFGSYLSAAVLLIVLTSTVTSILLQRVLKFYLLQPISRLAQEVRGFDLKQPSGFSKMPNAASELRQLSHSFQKMAWRIRTQATTDPVTLLRNRFYLEGVMREAELDLKGSYALLLLDLDHFKSINDNFGHPTGDHLLKRVAKRLTPLLHLGAKFVRMGGDEFAIWFRGYLPEEEILTMRKNVASAFSDPFVLGNGTVVHLQASGGLALYPRDVEHPNDLLKAADLALYQAKARRLSEVSRYTPDLANTAKEWLEIASLLREKLKNDELEFYTQPIVHTRAGSHWGQELLLRLVRSNGQAYNTETVLNVAKQVDLMGAITEKTFDLAIKLLCDNVLQGHLNINLSPEQVLSMTPLQIERYLLSTPLSIRKRLVIELTEQSFLERKEILGSIDRFSQLGYAVALDDFGSGYSSMSCLSRLPLSIVKLDKSLTRRILKSERDRVLLASLVEMSHEMGFQLIAEGIESYEQWVLVRDLGCDLVQGYFLGRPEKIRINRSRVEEA